MRQGKKAIASFTDPLHAFPFKSAFGSQYHQLDSTRFAPVEAASFPDIARKGECEGCAPQGAFRSATDAKRRHLARRWNL